VTYQPFRTPLEEGEQCECGARLIKSPSITNQEYVTGVNARSDALWERMFKEVRNKIELSTHESRRIYMVEFVGEDRELPLMLMRDVVEHRITAHIRRIV
jgi:hypothetical protein